ncbi:PREDICTED: LOW QUALITY PROTEIN: NACHT, LRR and PYD domains-containing protein 1 [Condylura cristata]|uniref:LOW QUALITY PROTEIN: NACHT, LRR and PYD domains-containing protein 1 n=1 Tax=Condylura cristata TaxID=143302 RepID=UPI000643312C|nr:PREDICTED: LOW QUALITY PROTEIN: NACHT, LRR and PYD domains-containing protein 1 [Condylura cristata]
MLSAQSVTVIRVQSMTTIKAQSVTMIRAQSVTMIRAQSVTMIRAQSVTMIKAQSVTMIRAQSMTMIRAQFVTVLKAECVAESCVNIQGSAEANEDGEGQEQQSSLLTQRIKEINVPQPRLLANISEHLSSTKKKILDDLQKTLSNHILQDLIAESGPKRTMSRSQGAQEYPHTVILHGDAGVGKSTLARQLRRAWLEGQLYRDRFWHVFYFNCRELNPSQTMSFTKFIVEYGVAPGASIGQMSQSEQLLFILDGLDEPEWDLEKQKGDTHLQWSLKQPLCSILSQLLRKTMFPSASLLITARTSALEKFIPSLKHPQWVEVLGLSESGRREYFCKYFTDEGQASRALSLVESNHVLWALCQLPWVSWLACTCLRQQMEQGRELSLTLQTTTALCLQYLSQALPTQTLGTQLRGLCSLAAEGIQHRKTLFTVEDLKKHGVEGSIVSALLPMVNPQDLPIHQSYNFTHLCLQQFLAAMSCVLGCSKEESGDPESSLGIREALLKYCRHDVFGAPTTQFVFGLLGEQGVREMESIFGCPLSGERRQELLKWTQEEVQQQYFSHQPYSLQLLRCLYEIQDKDFLTQVMVHFQGTSMCVENEVEFLVFTFCIKFCPHVQRLQLNEGGQEKQAWKHPTMVLYMSYPITDNCWRILFSISGIIENLMELDLSGNFLSSSAVQSLCEALRCPRCRLETLRLVCCGLTSSSCQALVSTLSTNTHLRELHLQQNNLGDLGLRLLCDWLRQPACLLRLLGLDQARLSEEVTEMLRALEQEKPQLHICGRSPQEVAGVEPICRSPPSPVGGPHMEPLTTTDELWGPTGHTAVEVVDQERSQYRAHLPTAGSHHWPNTGLHFVVRRAVTVEIEFCAWDPFLDTIVPRDTWMVAGPLFDIKADPGAVAAVYLPHFVSLQGDHVDPSQFHVAHFKEEGTLLEEPARVEALHSLENPSFSPMGVLLRIFPVTRKIIPIISTVMLYHHLRPSEINFHLYLVPNDCSIQKAIDEEEKESQYVRIRKPPPMTPLYLGSCFTVSGSEVIEIIPQELELCYRSPRESQVFSEIYVGQLESRIRLQIQNMKDGTVVWEALVTQASRILHRNPGQMGLAQPRTQITESPQGAEGMGWLYRPGVEVLSDPLFNPVPQHLAQE